MTHKKKKRKVDDCELHETKKKKTQKRKAMKRKREEKVENSRNQMRIIEDY